MGLGAMVVALLANATLMMGRSVFQGADRNAFKGAMIAALSFLGILYLHTNVVYIILVSGVLGILLFSFDGAAASSSRLKPPDAEIDLPATGGWGNLLPPAALAALLAALFGLVDGTWTLFLTFLKIGSLAFGGGFTAIPLIQSVVVDGMHWLDLTAFRDGIAMGQITPGPVFITAAFIGYKVQGVIGALVATIAIFTPSLVAITLLGRAHARIKNLKMVKAAIRGILSGFIGLLLFVVLQFGIQSLVNGQAWAVFVVSAVYLSVWKREVGWLILGTIGVSLLLF